MQINDFSPQITGWSAESLLLLLGSRHCHILPGWCPARGYICRTSPVWPGRAQCQAAAVRAPGPGRPGCGSLQVRAPLGVPGALPAVVLAWPPGRTGPGSAAPAPPPPGALRAPPGGGVGGGGGGPAPPLPAVVLAGRPRRPGPGSAPPPPPQGALRAPPGRSG